MDAMGRPGLPGAARNAGAVPDRRRWAVLAAGVVAISVGCLFQFGLPYLVPHLRAEGLSLSTASLLAASPSFGLMATLVLWGAAADRWGERVVLAAGLALAAPCLGAAASLSGQDRAGVATVAACLVAAGAAGACVHAASGRLILGWFTAGERGLAMGIRQTAQPIGVGTAALLLPALAGRGTPLALACLAAACAGAVVLVIAVVRDAPRPQRAPGAGAPVSPYRTPVLWRIHGASALLVLPQFTVAAFGLIYLVDVHGWSPVDGGRLLALAQGGGALARLAAGWWSDRVGSRTGPLRLTAAAIAVTLGALAATTLTRSPAAVALLVLAAVVTVSPNGLAFTAVAEYAGNSWAGRALGVQNTAQNAVAALTPPLLAMLIDGGGYAPAFALAAVLPVLAGGLVPHPLPHPPAAPAPGPVHTAG
ncbi:MAG TPA: MFS transporter [Kineosporiaceae bacterium]|nr:MFS transporter [Kineosporiaceae bacterium]